jgi:hypothetical protein
MLLSVGESAALDLAPSRERALLGTIGLAGVAQNDVVAKLPVHGQGRIVGFTAYTARKAAGESGSGSFQLLLNTTNLGAIAIGPASGSLGVDSFASGTTASGIASRFSDGDVLTIKAATASPAYTTSGAVSFYVDIARD